MNLTTLMALALGKKGSPGKAVPKPKKAKAKKAKSKPKGKSKSKPVVPLGHATAPALLSQAQEACNHYVNAAREIATRNLWGAVNCYFRAAAIASNVLFASKSEGIALPDKVKSDMNEIIDRSTLGIKKVMKVIAVQKIAKHVKKMHSSQKAESK